MSNYSGGGATRDGQYLLESGFGFVELVSGRFVASGDKYPFIRSDDGFVYVWDADESSYVSATGPVELSSNAVDVEVASPLHEAAPVVFPGWGALNVPKGGQSLALWDIGAVTQP